MTDIKQKIKNEQSGAVLVMALLILFLMMTSAVALSRIILGEVKMVVNTTNSLSAFYAADSAIEKGLYYIKYARKNRGLFTTPRQSTDPFNDLAFKSFPPTGPPYDFYYRKASSTSSGFTVYNVNTTTPAHIDIINPSGDLDAVINWGIAGYNSHGYFVSWSIKDCFPFHASDRLEITKHSFGSVGSLNSDTEKDIIICNCSYNSDIDISNNCDADLATGDILDDRYHRFSFKPLDGEVESLSFDIHAYDFGNPETYEIVSIPSNASIIAEGIFKNARYSLQVDLPAFGSTSDIFSYVIFSEEELKKDL
ncbi:MAG: hypothetical protein HOE19_04525 [Candidatus Komeilibacteria bacterium]|jgi:hypothetical protein|nr:hypothetical protein [Candidatus Komeilibacteria bacterium]MBT4447938.1 hypothetical protein [Candidatus Komeilibacteria bacterium]